MPRFFMLFLKFSFSKAKEKIVKLKEVNVSVTLGKNILFWQQQQQFAKMTESK